MNNNEKNCQNCDHSFTTGSGAEFRKCVRVGQYCGIEMKYGGKCSEGLELLLWAPKKTFMMKLVRMFKGEKE